MEYLTPGELLNELDYYDDEELLNVELTGEWGSYRGHYDQMFIGYRRKGGNYSTVEELKDIIYEALGAETMYGYKGGEFSVDSSTEICFAQDERSVSGLYVKRVTDGFDGLKIEVEEEE